MPTLPDFETPPRQFPDYYICARWKKLNKKSRWQNAICFLKSFFIKPERGFRRPSARRFGFDQGRTALSFPLSPCQAACSPPFKNGCLARKTGCSARDAALPKRLSSPFTHPCTCQVCTAESSAQRFRRSLGGEGARIGSRFSCCSTSSSFPKPLKRTMDACDPVRRSTSLRRESWSGA